MPQDHRKQRQFPREGYTILLDGDGIEIRVDDYKPLPLNLRWAVLDQMRAEAKAPPAAREGNAP